MPHGGTWPNVACQGATTADDLLVEVVQNVLNDPGATLDDKWTVIFLAGRCGRDHNLVVIDRPPQRANGCEYVLAARNSSIAPANWAQVRRELNHGGGAPAPRVPVRIQVPHGKKKKKTLKKKPVK